MDRRDRLKRLAESHIIGKEAPLTDGLAPKARLHDELTAGALMRAQLGGEQRVHDERALAFLPRLAEYKPYPRGGRCAICATAAAAAPSHAALLAQKTAAAATEAAREAHHRTHPRAAAASASASAALSLVGRHILLLLLLVRVLAVGALALDL